MKMLRISALSLAVLVAGLSGALSRTCAAADDVDHTAPSYDMKAQSLLDLGNVQKKLSDLANAVPADKLTWRPTPDSRSFAEVFLHVGAERYGILGMMGTEAPAGFKRQGFEKSTTDKARIIAELDKSWEFAQKALEGMSNADFAKLLPKLGPQANAGDVVYILVWDQHEHLGQTVAYARENSIVPPWTVVAQKKAAEKKAQQK